MWGHGVTDSQQPGVKGVLAELAFRERMEEQCSQIEQYRLAVKRDEGRVLSADEAALEWIERYAEAFAKGEKKARA